MNIGGGAMTITNAPFSTAPMGKARFNFWP